MLAMSTRVINIIEVNDKKEKRVKRNINTIIFNLI